MSLDARGIIAIVEIVIYVPVLFVGGILSLRHGFARRAGWIFLVILAIIRIIGGITHVLSELHPTDKTERIIYTIMEASGLSPLIIATLGFLRTVMQGYLDEGRGLSRILRVLGLIGTIALILSVTGGVNAANASSQSSLDSASTQRHIGAILFVALYVGAVGLTLHCWQKRDLIWTYRRRLLAAIMVTLPFLFVRVLYAIITSFAPYPFVFQNGEAVLTTPSTTGLGRFSSTSSQWGIYLVMSVLMEYITVLIYVVVGVVTPLDQDFPDNKNGQLSGEALAMGSRGMR